MVLLTNFEKVRRNFCHFPIFEILHIGKLPKCDAVLFLGETNEEMVCIFDLEQ